jgi:hypothetical protein
MFYVGDRVRVKKLRRYGTNDSEGGIGWIVRKNDNAENQRFGVEYVVDSHYSPSVKASRMGIAPIETTARLRSGQRMTRPSLLSHLPPSRLPQLLEPQQHRITSTGLMTSCVLLQLSKDWTQSKGAQNGALNPALLYLKKMNDKKEKGWLRKAEVDKAWRNVPKTDEYKKEGHLSQSEKQLIISLMQSLSSAGDSVATAIAFAWGLAPYSVRRFQKTALKSVTSNGLAVPRKVRSDKGTTLFTSDEKCKQVYTPLYVFKKVMRKANRGEELTDKELNDQWKLASPSTKANAKQKAVQLVQRAPYLIDEITRELKLTRGCITWRTLTAQVVITRLRAQLRTIMAAMLSFGRRRRFTSR